jgi:hypothetical protein
MESRSRRLPAWDSGRCRSAGEAPAGTLAAIVIRHKKSAETLKYTVGDSWLPKLTEWNRTLDPRGRYEAV